jgi:hypothetical protein
MERDDQINPVRASIARISDEEICAMSAADLAELLRFSPDTPPQAELPQELSRTGRPGLRIQALLARLRCREEINAICERRGFPAPRYSLG